MAALRVNARGIYCSITAEFWMAANLDKLPVYLLIVGRKESPNKTAGGDT